MVWSLQNSPAGHTATTPQNARLVSAAHQFEASLMAEVMKPLQEDSLFSEDKDGDSSSLGGGSGNALTGFASEALGRCLSEHGGFGIARQILSRLGDQEHSSPASDLAFQAPVGNSSQSGHSITKVSGEYADVVIGGSDR
jgi:Rod binding domain-containing protein